MRVTFCAQDDVNYVNGPNVWLRRLLPELASQGIQCRVLFTASSDPKLCPTITALREDGVNCEGLYGFHCTEERVKWILRMVKEDPADVFVPNLMIPGYYAGRWLRKAGIPTVGVLHSDDSFHRGILSEFVFGKLKYRLSSLVCVSRYLAEQISSMRLDDVLTARIPYGVPIPRLRSERSTEGFKIAYVGRLVEQQKRISDVVLAFCRMTREIPGSEALIFGDGEGRINAERVLHEKGKDLPVYLLGRVESTEIQNYLLRCHAIAMLSDYEGLPIALMEAMACGVVPICLRTRSGIPELVEDGVTGLIVDDRKDGVLAAAHRLSSDLQLWERLSRAARARIEAEYSVRECGKRWGELLLGLRSRFVRPSLRLPRYVSLPSVNPSLAREDFRRPSVFRRVIQKSRHLGNRISRKLQPVRGGLAS